MDVKVTAEDISQGKMGSACHCPVALAVKRATCATVVLDVKPPAEVVEFIRAFDRGRGHELEPFSFRLP